MEVLPFMNNMQDKVTKNALAAVPNDSAEREWWRDIRVSDIMSSPAICVDGLTAVTEAQQLMRRHKIRRVPVLDGRKLVGILTQGDVRGAMPSEVTTLNRTEQDYLISHLKVNRVMSKEVITATREMSLADATRLLAQYKISGLPVIDDDTVVGMVTESDVFETIAAMFDKLDQR
jgi:acetoin utilization protein AcuB